MLASTRRIRVLFPPYFIRRCEVYGKGVYLTDEYKMEVVFGEMLHFMTKQIARDAFLIEFRNLGNALWGYKYFRENDYFPINWLRVRNSLHSQKTAVERFSPSRLRQIKKALKNGATVEEAHTPEEIREFAKLLHKFYAGHIRKHFPNMEFFFQMEDRKSVV